MCIIIEHLLHVTYVLIGTYFLQKKINKSIEKTYKIKTYELVKSFMDCNIVLGWFFPTF